MTRANNVRHYGHRSRCEQPACRTCRRWFDTDARLRTAAQEVDPVDDVGVDDTERTLETLQVIGVVELEAVEDQRGVAGDRGRDPWLLDGLSPHHGFRLTEFGARINP